MYVCCVDCKKFICVNKTMGMNHLQLTPFVSPTGAGLCGRYCLSHIWFSYKFKIPLFCALVEI